jgi:hypothetical protein
MPCLPVSLRPLVERERFDHDAGGYADDAWRLPERVPDEVCPALPRLIAEYDTRMRAATTQEIAVILGRLAVHFPLPDRPAEHHHLAFADYSEDVIEYPIGVIAEVARDWRRTEKWWPKICELRERCEALLRRRGNELVRLKFLRWCVERFGGEVPRLLRYEHGRLRDHRDSADCQMLEKAMAGERDFGATVLVPPGASIRELELARQAAEVEPQPDPVIVEHRRRINGILEAAGFSLRERWVLGEDMTEEYAQALAAERVAERARQERAGLVLRILLAGGVPIREIEARSLLDLDQDAARQLVTGRTEGAR